MLACIYHAHAVLAKNHFEREGDGKVARKRRDFVGGTTKNVILALVELGKHKITLIRNSNVAHAE